MRGIRLGSRARVAVLLVSGALMAGCVAVVHGRSAEGALVVGGVFSALVALVSGLVLVGFAGRDRPALRPAAVLLGVGMVLWGLGQLVTAWTIAGGGPAYPGPGDVLQTVAAPLGVAGLVLAMRPRSLRTHWVRMCLDALLMSTALSLLIWRLSLRGLLFSAGFAVGDALTVLILVIETTIFALLLLTFLRDHDRGLLLALLGVTGYVVADQVTLHQLSAGGDVPWFTPVVWAVSWPLVAEGLMRFEPVDEDDGGSSSEARVAVATTVIGFGSLVGALAHIGAEPSVDLVTVALSILVVGVYAVREVYGGVQRGRLVGRLTTQALSDPLTGLGNRRALTACLDRVTAQRTGAVLTLDLDGFKSVNDLLGHQMGDELLVAVADRVRAVLPTGAEAFRVGGDEFVVVVPGTPGKGESVATSLLVGVREVAAALIGAGSATTSASVGLARWPTSGPDDAARAVLHESGVALHAAKQWGRGRVERYGGAVAAQHVRAADVERQLRAALAAGGLDVHYQPVLSLQTGRVVSVEALARWDDPVLGRVGPDEFIPVAERSSLIGVLGTYVLERALRDVRSLGDLYPDLRVNVNASPVQLRGPRFADAVAATAARHGMAPDRLVVEVTESAFVGDEEVVIRNLEQLRRQGTGVAIDDFGSGYSSLGYLNLLPATVLKVDQSLARAAVVDARALSVLRAVVELGRSLPMAVAVEGIETTQMHDTVRGLAADYGQGWLYSKAVPLPELSGVIEELHARAAALVVD